MANEQILIVEDEETIRELLTMALESEGYHVLASADGEAGLEMARKRQPDLILLDLMLPGVDGLTVCRTLAADAATRAIPVVMLTARSEESDIVLGLEVGACDYITKPFNRKILIARIRAHLRRVREAGDSREVRHAGLLLDIEAHTAMLHGADLALTVSEFTILHMLAEHAGRVFTRNQFIARLRGDSYVVTERAVDVQILNLRKKLGDWGEFIETVRGIGYRLKRED